MNKDLRIFLVDDHSLVRAGLRVLLDQLDYVQVVGEASDGREALALLSEIKVDVALMDIAMPNMNGLEATSRLAKEAPWVKVIILSGYLNEEYVSRALCVGAAGYLLKNALATA